MYYYVWREVPMTASLSMATEQKEVDSWDVIKIMKTEEEYRCWLSMPKPKGWRYRYWNNGLIRWYWRRHGMNTSWVISKMSKDRIIPQVVSKYEYDMLDAVDIPHANPADFIAAGPR
jgi:hypothetical protein